MKTDKTTMKPDKRTMKLAEISYYIKRTFPDTPRLLKRFEKICLQNIEEFAEGQGFKKKKEDEDYEFFLHTVKLYIENMKKAKKPDLSPEEVKNMVNKSLKYLDKMDKYLKEYCIKKNIKKYL